MGFLENYCAFKVNSILISKLSIHSLNNYPRFKLFLFYFIINLKYYKKNLLLFYLMVNLMFGGISFTKKKWGTCVVLKMSIKKKKIFIFLQSFINLYLPLLSSPENIYKSSVVKKRVFLANISYYRFNYFYFPPIPELDLIYEDFELIYDFINNFKFQLDIFIKNPKNIRNSGEILLRIYKFPCLTKLNNF